MKWVIFVSLLCFVSLAELKNLPRRYRNTDDHHWTIRLASQISANDFGAIVLVLFAQALPNTTLEELKTLSANVKTIHQKCVDNQYSSPECTKPLTNYRWRGHMVFQNKTNITQCEDSVIISKIHDFASFYWKSYANVINKDRATYFLGIVFLDLLCHDEEFSKKYGINDCCAKSDPERHECVLSHKISAIGSVSPFVRPTAEEACQAYHNDRNDVLAHHLYEISRRNARAPVTVLSAATKSFDKILETCCKEVEKDTCIEGKATVVRNKAREIIDEQENTCFNLENYGKETLYELKFIQIAEKFINANLEILTHIAKEVVHIHEATCKGDSLGTLLDRADLSEYVCKHKNDISHNLDHCCEKGLVERSQCIVTMENDPLSPDLPTPSGETFKETACQYYVEHGSINKESFLLALIRTHPELSQLFDLEILHRYGDTLEKCCKREDKVQCLNDGEEQNRLYVKKISDFVKNNCNNYKEIGEYFFQNEYLIKYSKIIPQAPTSNLIELAKKVAKLGEKCCNLDGDQQVSCALDNTDKVIGSICKCHKGHYLNKQIDDCCHSSFINRWQCISNLGPDPSYNPPPFQPKALDAPEKLCSSNEATVQESKQGLLSDLIKSKPNISDEELAVGILAFRELQTDCCAAANQKECFDTKGQKLVERIQSGHIIE